MGKSRLTTPRNPAIFNLILVASRVERVVGGTAVVLPYGGPFFMGDAIKIRDNYFSIEVNALKPRMSAYHGCSSRVNL